MKLGVSVIVCCYNSVSRLPDTLEHIALQQCREEIDWELVIVDNASTDGTGEYAEYQWKQYQISVPIRVIHEASPGLIAARITGVQQAQYEFITFVDDDNWIAENWIELVYNTLKDKPLVGACGGHNTAVFEGDSPDWFPTFQHLFAVGQQASEEGVLPEEKYELWGAGLSLRRSAWMNMREKGFTSLLSGRKGKTLSAGEDAEICFALKIMGYQLYYNPSLQLRHFIPANRLEWTYVQRIAVGFAESRFILTSYDYFYRKPRLIESYPYLYLSIYFLYNLGLLLRSALYREKQRNYEGNYYHIEWVRRLNIIKSFNWYTYLEIVAKMKKCIKPLRSARSFSQ